MRRFDARKCVLFGLIFLAGRCCLYADDVRPAHITMTVFNVKDYGATGKKPDNAGPAIQKAIDAAASAGGGVVYLHLPVNSLQGTLRLRSHVRHLHRVGRDALCVGGSGGV